MTVDAIVVGILAILLLGLAIYLWIDRKKWFKKSLQRMTQNYTLQEELNETKSLLDALDEENAELTVKCNQYEALIGERLDAIPEVDCYEVDCEKCLVGDCPYNIDENDGVGGFSNMLDDDIEAGHIAFKKPCCSCWNGVYNIPACIDCGPENNYENYTPMYY